MPNLFTTGALFSGFYAIVAAMNGLFVPFWYAKLETTFIGTGAKAVMCKSLSDIVVQGGIGNAISIFARGAPMSEVLREMPEVLCVDVLYWLPYNLVAFSRIPLHMRPTGTAIMTLGFNTYLSYVAARGRREGGEG